MFWKKKQTFNIDLPETDSDHRVAFRVKPDAKKPVVLTIAGSAYYAVNISGSGCCIRSYSLQPGYTASGTVKFPSEDAIFPITLVVKSRKNDLCHCEFTSISAAAQDIIHHYVLDIQKNQIRKNAGQ